MKKETFENRIIAMQDTLYRVSVTILSEPHDREDAIQESICRALRKWEHLRDERYLETWLVRILINECYSILRRKKRLLPMETLPEPMPASDADPEVFHLLFSLEDTLRLPLVLYYVEGYSTKEIAAILRIPEGTVRSRMARGRKKLRERLKEEWEDA